MSVDDLRSDVRRELERILSGHQRDMFARVFRKVGKVNEEAWFEVMALLASAAP